MRRVKNYNNSVKGTGDLSAFHHFQAPKKMECDHCKLLKLSTEFRSTPLTQNCNHIPFQCTSCLYKAVQTNKQCPTCKAKVEKLDWEPQIYKLPATGGLGDSSCITVILLEGDHLAIPYNPQMTVGELKHKLYTHTKVPQNKQLLIVNGKPLQVLDQKFRPITLHEQGVEGGASIHLIILKYTIYAGQTTIDGAPRDVFDNALGSKYDLVEDGTFRGLTILVLQLYTGEGFAFQHPQAVLEEKGFQIVRYTYIPPLNEFHEQLDKACQLWLISTSNQRLNAPYIDAIRFFFEEGHGVYIWGDNDPYFVDANILTQSLFGISMSGNLPGGQVVHAQTAPDPNNMKAQGSSVDSGFFPHLITTGLENLFEGITIATINVTKESKLEPLVRGSQGNLLVVIYDRDGKRCIIDGGFTRLYCSWDTAGTGRYVKNSAAWLVNYERFFDVYNI